jgi:hypothetical protein
MNPLNIREIAEHLRYGWTAKGIAEKYGVPTNEVTAQIKRCAAELPEEFQPIPWPTPRVLYWHLRETDPCQADHEARVWAKQAVMEAIRKGKIQKPNICSDCGDVLPMVQIQGHHREGYAPAKWLVVTWLCGPCHREAHRREGKPWGHILKSHGLRAS